VLLEDIKILFHCWDITKIYIYIFRYKININEVTIFGSLPVCGKENPRSIYTSVQKMGSLRNVLIFSGKTVF